jgi:hypothetical protein
MVSENGRHWVWSLVTWISLTSPKPTDLNVICRILCNLRLVLPRGVFLSFFPTKILCEFNLFPWVLFVRSLPVPQQDTIDLKMFCLHCQLTFLLHCLHKNKLISEVFSLITHLYTHMFKLCLCILGWCNFRNKICVAVNAYNELVVVLLYCTLVSCFGRLFRKFHKSGLLRWPRHAVCRESGLSAQYFKQYVTHFAIRSKNWETENIYADYYC